METSSVSASGEPNGRTCSVGRILPFPSLARMSFWVPGEQMSSLWRLMWSKCAWETNERSTGWVASSHQPILGSQIPLELRTSQLIVRGG